MHTRLLTLAVGAWGLVGPGPRAGGPPRVAARRRAAARDVLWTPTPEAVEATAMRQFQKHVGVAGDYEALWRWSVDEADAFWAALLDWTGTVYEGSSAPTRTPGPMPDCAYFPDVRLNFAENLLRHGAPGAAREHAEAVVSVSEARPDRRWTFGQLRDDAARARAALAALGVGADDAVGAYVPNVGESLVAMLGATATSFFRRPFLFFAPGAVEASPGSVGARRGRRARRTLGRGPSRTGSPRSHPACSSSATAS